MWTKGIIAGAAVAALVACGEKPATSGQDLEKVFADKKAAAAASPAQEHLQGMVNQAATALKNNDDIAAVAALQNLRQSPELSVDQYTTVQDLMAKAQKQLVDRAARGDAQAIAALEMMKMNPR